MASKGSRKQVVRQGVQRGVEGVEIKPWNDQELIVATEDVTKEIYQDGSKRPTRIQIAVKGQVFTKARADALGVSGKSTTARKLAEAEAEEADDDE